MGVERLDPFDLTTEAVEALGLDADALDLFSVEVLAASIRRAASFLCPTTPGALVRAVTEVLSGLPGFDEKTRDQVDDVVESLVSYGDLFELPLDDVGGKRRHLFLGPPAYVRRTNGCLLLGVRPEGAPLVSEGLPGETEHDGHVRLIRPDGSESVHELLAAEGLTELQSEQWLKAPRQSTPEEAAAVYIDRLGVAVESGSIDGVRVIDPASSVDYYRGRWRSLRPSDNGQFVARRPQAFGADLWCFADVRNGEVETLIDLPVQAPLAPGSDEAWRLQAALDAAALRPQRLRVRDGGRPAWATVDFFSPLPSWAQRRLDAVGAPVLRSRGALFSYAVLRAELGDEVNFLERMMWLSSTSLEGGGADGQ